VESALRDGATARDDRWSDAIAVGSKTFVEQVKAELGSTVGRRRIAAENKTYTLRESFRSYSHYLDGENSALSQNNAYIWDSNVESTNT